MRRLILLLFFVMPMAASAQNYSDYGLNKIRIADSDKTIVLEINPVNGRISAKPNLFYYWYSANLIHMSQGGYSGKLLNGNYEEFYLNKNLKQQGIFKKGLKDGVWKNWNKNGLLIQTIIWKSGIDITGAKPKFWQRIDIFKKKDKISPDSTSK